MSFFNFRWKQIIGVLFLVTFLILLIIYITESPFVFSVKNISKSKRASIAIRDNVIPFQKVGTKLFTVPYLTKYYDTLCYFTQCYNDVKKTDFINSLNYLLDNYSTVDVFLLAHSNNYIEWIKEIDSLKVSNIRLVYNTGCIGINQAQKWKSIGVRTYISHIGEKSLSPVFYIFFLRRWCKGYTLKDAVYESNEEMKNKLFLLNKFGLNINKKSIFNSKAEITGDSLLTIDFENEKK